ARAVGGIAGRHHEAPRLARRSGKEADLADVVLGGRARSDRDVETLAAAIHFDVQPLPSVHREDELRVTPPRHRVAVDREEAVARLESRRGSRRILLDDLDDRSLELVGGHPHSDREDGRVEDESQHHVHERTREQDQRALPTSADRRRLGRSPVRERRFVRPETDDLDVAAERDRRDPVVRAVPLLSKEPLAETDRKDLDGEPEGLGHGEMAKLVDDHEDRQDQDQRQRVLEDVQPNAPWIETVFAFRESESTVSAALRRAISSISSASSRLPGEGTRPAAEAVSATTRTIPGKEIFPSRKAATAISLAALTTAGIPPCESAARATATSGYRSGSRSKNSSFPTSTRSSRPNRLASLSG